MAPPLNLDASHSAWPELTEAPALVLCINMIHIAPWAACQGLLAQTARLLAPGAALVLYALEGMSYKEIADVLGISVGTVMSRIFNARQRLRELLASEIG